MSLENTYLSMNQITSALNISRTGVHSLVDTGIISPRGGINVRDRKAMVFSLTDVLELRKIKDTPLPGSVNGVVKSRRGRTNARNPATCFFGGSQADSPEDALRENTELYQYLWDEIDSAEGMPDGALIAGGVPRFLLETKPVTAGDSFLVAFAGFVGFSSNVLFEYSPSWGNRSYFIVREHEESEGYTKTHCGKINHTTQLLRNGRAVEPEIPE